MRFIAAGNDPADESDPDEGIARQLLTPYQRFEKLARDHLGQDQQYHADKQHDAAAVQHGNRCTEKTFE